ncbi:MAG: helix-turn-helix transcriptional regulator [Acidiferrobacter sp.]
MRRGSDHDVADLLGISVDRLQKRIQGGELVPLYIQVPGARSRIWDMDEVETWLKGFRRTPLTLVPTPQRSLLEPKRGRGRPPKTAYRI